MEFSLSPADRVLWILTAIFFGIGAFAPASGDVRLNYINWMLLGFFCIALSVLI